VEASGPNEHTAERAYPARVPGSHKSARVTTRTGDGGETSLFGKDRVRKTDPRVIALGDLDEAQSAIGMARAMAPKTTLGRELLEIQRGLYVAMSEVATPPADLARLPQRLDAGAIERLDRVLEMVRKTTKIEGRFVIPGEAPIAAAVDHARTVARRAERSVVGCVDAGLVSADPILPWLNRASDVLFVLARASERAPRPSKTAVKTPARRVKR
jgi:cob(I)alamin adenosyltransferase